MVSDPHVFGDLALVFLAAVVGGAAAWALRQPLILGYVFGGLLISPFTPGPSVADLRSFDLFAEIGVVLLMFSIGLEFSVRDLLRVKWVAFLGGPLGVLLVVGMGTATGIVMGWGALTGLVVGMVISVCSTMVLARLLIDRGELHSRHGRIMMGVSLVEDLAAIALMVLLPSLGGLEPGRFLAIGTALGKAALILLPFLYIVSKVIPPFMTQLARMRSPELFLLVALAIGLGTAALTQAVGLSLALGAFLAGLLISESDYAHETLARLLPLRDMFGALFFVTVGGLIDPRTVLENLPGLGTIVALVVVGKAVIRAAVVRLFGHPLPTAILVGVGLAQIGEFSFVLVKVARDAGHVDAGMYNAILAASLITLLLNAGLVRIGPGWLGRLRLWFRSRPEPARAAAPAELPAAHVVLCGFGRVGSAIGEALDSFEIRYLVIEADADIIRGLRERGIPSVFGDATRRRVLERAGAAHAALVMVALPEIDRAHLVVQNVRRLNREAPVLVRSHDPAAFDALTRAGATEVIQPEVEAAATLIRHALRRLRLPQDRVLAYLDRFHRAMMLEAETGPSRDHLPQIADITLGAGELADRSLREARIRERLGVTIVAVTRADGQVMVNPSADTIMREGDHVRVFGLPEQIAGFRDEAQA